LIELSLSGRREDRDTFAMFRGTPEDIAAVCSTRIGEMRAEGFANATTRGSPDAGFAHPPGARDWKAEARKDLAKARKAVKGKAKLTP